MVECRYPDAHFNVSFFDLFVQGASGAGALEFTPDLARAIAAANALLARWDDPTGFEAAELPYLRSYGELLVRGDLACLDYQSWVDAGAGEELASFSVSLAKTGVELLAYLTRLDPGLLESSDPLNRARRALALRRRFFATEIERGEREAEREREAGNLDAALGWAYPTLRLDPDNAATREVVAVARAADPVLPEVHCGRWVAAVEAVDGWLSPPEAAALARCVAAAPGAAAPDVIEVGSYKGRSTLAIACAIAGLGLPLHLTAVDPHERYRYGDAVDTLAALTSNLKRNGVEGVVTVIRSRGDEVPLDRPFSFAFIDGLHDEESVRADCAHILPSLVSGGLLAFHDYFEHYPGIVAVVGDLIADDGEYEFVECADRLVVLRRLPGS